MFKVSVWRERYIVSSRVPYLVISHAIPPFILQAVHAQQLQDMECRHKQEMNFLMENREQEMVEETKATKAALELLRQSYEDSLALERKRLISFFSSMTGPFSASAVQRSESVIDSSFCQCLSSVYAKRYVLSFNGSVCLRTYV